MHGSIASRNEGTVPMEYEIEKMHDGIHGRDRWRETGATA